MEMLFNRTQHRPAIMTMEMARSGTFSFSRLKNCESAFQRRRLRFGEWDGLS